MGVSLLYLVGHTLENPGTSPSPHWSRPNPGRACCRSHLDRIWRQACDRSDAYLASRYLCLCPTGVTAILTGATKAGVLVALFLSLSALPSSAIVPSYLGVAISLLAVLTMTIGNLLALNQPGSASRPRVLQRRPDGIHLARLRHRPSVPICSLVLRQGSSL